MTPSNCRACDTQLKTTFVDLYSSPLANSLLKKEHLCEPEEHYPLHVKVCPACYLVQLEETRSPKEMFDRDYLYFSSYSTSWLEDCKKYAQEMIQLCELNKDKKVVEIACNDGYLLQFFKNEGIPVLGVEPAKNVASEAQKKGIEVVTEFFNAETAAALAKKGHKADLIAAKNVFAHVPNINSFAEGIKILLKEEGVFTIEFPHLLQLIKEGQFDTVYHEHYSYLSLISVVILFKKHGLRLFDVKELPTHGGSLRIYGCHEASKRQTSDNVQKLLETEKEFGLMDLKMYENFSKVVDKIKLDTLAFLIEAKKKGQRVVGYGAPAKGNTFLNYCGIKSDLLEATVDISPHKQNRFLPGSRIPIFDESYIKNTKPDYVLILPWNLTSEISQQLAYIKDWGAKFVTAIPKLKVF